MKILYHASNNPNLEILKPHRTLSNDKYIGDFVFATEDKILATMYLIPKGYGSIMIYDAKPPRILIRADEAGIKSKDTGGAIYSVNASDFENSPQKDLTAFEKAANKPVKPIAKEVFGSAFKEWESMGIEVEFIEQATFDRLAKK